MDAELQAEAIAESEPQLVDAPVVVDETVVTASVIKEESAQQPISKKQKEQYEEPKPIHSKEPKRELVIPETDEDIEEGWGAQIAIVVLLLAISLLAVLRRFAIKARQQIYTAQPAKSAVKQKPEKQQEPEQQEVTPPSKAEPLISQVDIERLVQDKVQWIVNSAGIDRGISVDQTHGKVKFKEQRLMRIPVQRGAMVVHWKGNDGSSQRAIVINISMHGILFEADEFSSNAIDAVECPSMAIQFDIANSTIIRKEAGVVAVRIEAFKDKINDQMKWVETLTRIEKVSS
jgi:hypothetical protein